MEEITKTAIITGINGSQITLTINSCSACQDCSAKNFCSMSENQDKEIIVETAEAADYYLGEEVNVSISSAQGLKAVVYGYVLPLILLLAATIGAQTAGATDFISGISGIIVLIPYYFSLFLLKNKLKSDFQFKISKKN